VDKQNGNLDIKGNGRTILSVFISVYLWKLLMEVFIIFRKQAGVNCIGSSFNWELRVAFGLKESRGKLGGDT